MEHFRPEGLSRGYFCCTCGDVVSMMGHKDCKPNPELVKKLSELNDRNVKSST